MLKRANGGGGPILATVVRYPGVQRPAIAKPPAKPDAKSAGTADDGQTLRHCVCLRFVAWRVAWLAGRLTTRMNASIGEL